MMTTDFLKSLKEINIYEINLPSEFDGYKITRSGTLNTAHALIEEWDKKTIQITSNSYGKTIIKMPYNIGKKKFIKDARRLQKEKFLDGVSILIKKYENGWWKDCEFNRQIITHLRTYLCKDRADSYLNEYFCIVQLASR